MYVLSVTAAMSTVTNGECKVKDANGRGGCEYRRPLACPLTRTRTTTSSNSNNSVKTIRRRESWDV